MHAHRWFSFGVIPAAVLTLAVVDVRAGDIDQDGVEDSIDECCDTPPGIDVDAVGRPLGDIDGDCDVDLLDFDLLQSTFTGPRAAGCWADADCADGDPCTVDQCVVEKGTCTSIAVPRCSDCVTPPECTALVCDNPAEGEINPFIETDTYCFCVTEAENVRITVAELAGSGVNFAPNWRVLEAGGEPLGPCGAFAITEGRDCGPLPASGNPYRVEVEDQARNDIGFYSVHLHRLGRSSSCGQTALGPCEAATPGTINDPNDADLIAFDVADAGRIRIRMVEDPLSGANFSPNWRLVDGDGVPTVDCGTFSASARDCGPLGSAVNPYRIEVEDAGRDDVGAYVAAVQRLTSSTKCGVVSAECGTTVAGTIDPAVDSDLYNFPAGGNEIIRITAVKGTPVGANFSVNWRVLDVTGTAATSCSAFAASVSRDCGPFSSLGSPFRIEVEDAGLNDTGAYRIRLQRLTQYHECRVADVTCDSPVVVTIDEGVDSELVRFVAPSAEMVRVSVLEQPGSGANFAPNWRLLSAAGVPSSNCSAFSVSTSRDCGPLPASGNPYRVEVEDQTRDDLGSARVLVEFLTTGCSQ